MVEWKYIPCRESNPGRPTRSPSLYRLCYPGHLMRRFIHSSVALQLSVGPWPPHQFRNIFYTNGWTPWRSTNKATQYTNLRYLKWSFNTTFRRNTSIDSGITSTEKELDLLDMISVYLIWTHKRYGSYYQMFVCSETCCSNIWSRSDINYSPKALASLRLGFH
jgi:hypothetical protein